MHTNKLLLKLAALFHLEFESIHPFVNANGRTGQLMSNFLLMQAGYEPINIQAESCARYISAIRAFQTEEDPYPFAAFFCLNLEDHLLKIIEMLEPGSTSSCATGPSRINSYLTEYAALIAESPPSPPSTKQIKFCAKYIY